MGTGIVLKYKIIQAKNMTSPNSVKNEASKRKILNMLRNSIEITETS